MSTPAKVCSNVEGKSQAEEHDRIIQVDARRSDAAEVKRRRPSRPRKNQGAPKMPDPKTKERRQRSGGMLTGLVLCIWIWIWLILNKTQRQRSRSNVYVSNVVSNINRQTKRSRENVQSRTSWHPVTLGISSVPMWKNKLILNRFSGRWSP